MRYGLAGVVLAVLATPLAAQPEPQPQPSPPPPPPDDPKPDEPKPPEPPVTPVEPPKKPPAVEPSKAVIAADEQPLTITEHRDRGFRFGSYGRVIAGVDLRGGKPSSENVVAHGPRIVEPSYLELDFSYGFETPSGKRLRPVITLAFDSTLFHDTGDFDAQPALRNVFLEAQLTRRLTGWVGSRMYRGDDIYLFDYWPLDDLNTVGGGLAYRHVETEHHGGNVIELATHAGVNRLNRDFQFQEVQASDPAQGATTVTQLNRQRVVVSANATFIMDNGIADPNFKFKVHGEVHALGAGTRAILDANGARMGETRLPADQGYLIGIEAGTFGYAPSRFKFRRHLNAFARYATGLAAFDELAPPTSFGSDLKTNRASELTFGASGNWDHALGHLMLGALSRRFVDADGTSTDYDDGWEYALNVRPLARVPATDVFVGADVSYQARFPRGLSPTTLRAQDPAVFQLAPMLVYSPMGPSGYDRPQLRVVYRAAHRNEAARDLFVPDDPRRDHTWTHFLGVQAEWWFNSTTYR